MSLWSEQPLPEPPARRYRIGSAEDDCLGMLVGINAQADAAWMALYDGEIERAERLVAELRNMANSCLSRLEERGRG